ncbi:MAG: lamin tail domain-containing protein, partial [Verrucomicrobiota bacterium]
DSARVIDEVRFKGQENGASLGRYREGVFGWYALTPTSNTQNALPALHPVLSEIMYRPPDHPTNNVRHEYIEILNPATNDVDLWNAEGPWRLDGGVEFTFPSNTSLAAGTNLLVVSFDPTNTALLNDFHSTYGLTQGQVTVLGPYSGQLNNRGERVALERPQAEDVLGEGGSWVIVDEAIYFHQAPWYIESDGTGLSLHRKCTRWDGNDPANWYVAPAPSPGAPVPVYGPPGIPAWWFPETDPGWTNNFALHALADADLDGMPTWMEYIAGTHPTNPMSVSHLTITHTGGVTTVGFDLIAAGRKLNGLERFHTLQSSLDLEADVFMNLPGAADLLGADTHFDLSVSNAP